MKVQTKARVSGVMLSVLLLSACISAPVEMEDRDTSGAHDGVWELQVGAPKSSKVLMPGSYVMNCSWEPYNFNVLVEDGAVRMSEVEDSGYVAVDGRFRFDVPYGEVSLIGGVMSQDGGITGIFTGTLNGDESVGKFVENIPAIGGNACTADVRIRKT
ncbi:MAG: hypothetical protein AB8B63_17555 [Granulosicoccus sp.]